MGEQQYTFKQLRDMKVTGLQEIAKNLQSPELEGYSTMHKDHLLPLLCKVLNIPTHHIAHGAAKTKVKTIIRKVEAKRDEALKAKDYKKAAAARRQIHVLKHKLRNMAEAAA
jgi:protein-arginine kinase activator protein McsA